MHQKSENCKFSRLQTHLEISELANNLSHLQIDEELKLPIEEIAKILSWLPVKSLLRFKFVCREWRDLILSKSFVRLHLNRAQKSFRFDKDGVYERRLRALCATTHPVEGCKYIKDKIHTFDLSSIVCRYKDGNNNDCLKFKRLRATKGSPHVEPVGSCNGIVCLTSVREHCGFTLLNPSTGTHLELPELQKTVSLRRGHFLFIGFGYDYMSCAYKVVRINQLQRVDSNEGYDMFQTEINVFSTREKRWDTYYDEFHILFARRRYPTFEKGALSGNALYWFAKRRHYDKDEHTHRDRDVLADDQVFIVSFDLCTNKFFSEPLALPVDIKILETVDLFYVNRRLHFLAFKDASIRIHRAGVSRTRVEIDLWVLKGYDSWCRLANIIVNDIDIDPCCEPTVLTYSVRSSEILLDLGTAQWSKNLQHVVIVDLDTGEIKALPNVICPENVHSMTIQPYVESLVDIRAKEGIQSEEETLSIGDVEMMNAIEEMEDDEDRARERELDLEHENQQRKAKVCASIDAKMEANWGLFLRAMIMRDY